MEEENEEKNFYIEGAKQREPLEAAAYLAYGLAESLAIFFLIVSEKDREAFKYIGISTAVNIMNLREKLSSAFENDEAVWNILAAANDTPVLVANRYYESFIGGLLGFASRVEHWLRLWSKGKPTELAQIDFDEDIDFDDLLENWSTICDAFENDFDAPPSGMQIFVLKEFKRAKKVTPHEAASVSLFQGKAGSRFTTEDGVKTTTRIKHTCKKCGSRALVGSSPATHWNLRCTSPDCDWSGKKSKGTI